MQRDDFGHVFAAQGYLALSLPQMEDTGLPLDRHWLAAGNMADIKVDVESSSLSLTVSVRGTVYVRNSFAVSTSGQVQQSVDRAQPKMLTPQHTCSCWCLASIDQIGSWCFRFRKATDAQQFADSLQQSVKAISKPSLTAVPGHANPPCLSAHETQKPRPDVVQAGSTMDARSQQLVSMVHDALNDPDLPELVRIVEEIWGQLDEDTYRW
eukprot:jgi/Ulvmu1/5030/UM021_0047.1